MTFLTNIFHTILDALFPISSAETELFSYSPEEVLQKLPVAPDYSGLVITPNDSKFMDSIFAYKDERVAKMIWNIKYKKSHAAISIGGFALHQKLRASTISRFVRDTPYASAEASAGSPSPTFGPKRPSESLVVPALLIIPMPITNRRRKERGYNQCELLLDEIQNIAERDGRHDMVFEKDLLIRTLHADRQTLKGRADRQESAKGIFGVNEEVARKFLDQHEKNQKNYVVIIDDVITTGSTMKEAIDTLKNAGFEDVRGLSLAH